MKWIRRFVGTTEGVEKFSLEGESDADGLRTKTVTIAPQTDGTYQLSFLPDTVRVGVEATVNGLYFGRVRKVTYQGMEWGFPDEKYVQVARAAVQPGNPIIATLLAEAKKS